MYTGTCLPNLRFSDLLTIFPVKFALAVPTVISLSLRFYRLKLGLRVCDVEILFGSAMQALIYWTGLDWGQA
ncbi:hypothetical protein LOK49_LG15G00797 [Camellia lanceoleosa]|uniref:Uncharacterized protein n=1 Tax=Camellia lanceoleosa TaxID=1840588 RepID=A0ACC0F466_9ERIC|nr:hypothetical protein LOK49_LG15G00797 [Camellia lanceoleosa]